MSEPIKKEIKEEILFRIKNEGLSVPDAAKHYGINNRTIYGWLAKAGINNPSSQKLYGITLLLTSIVWFSRLLITQLVSFCFGVILFILKP